MILAQPIARKQKEHSLPLSLRCTTEHMYNTTRYEFIISEYRNRQWSVQACSQFSDISSPEKIYISPSSIYLRKNEKTNNSKRKHIKYKVTSSIFLIVLTHHVYEKPFSQKNITAHSAYPEFFFPEHHAESLSFQANLLSFQLITYPSAKLSKWHGNCRCSVPA